MGDADSPRHPIVDDARHSRRLNQTVALLRFEEDDIPPAPERETRARGRGI
jgi:hypothetical protein